MRYISKNADTAYVSNVLEWNGLSEYILHILISGLFPSYRWVKMPWKDFVLLFPFLFFSFFLFFFFLINSVFSPPDLL